MDAGDELGGGRGEDIPKPQARARQSVEPGVSAPRARPLELVAEGMGGGLPLVPGLAGRQSLVAVVDELEQRRQEVLTNHPLEELLEVAHGIAQGLGDVVWPDDKRDAALPPGLGRGGEGSPRGGRNHALQVLVPEPSAAVEVHQEPKVPVKELAHGALGGEHEARPALVGI